MKNLIDMIEFGGKVYVIDMNKLDKVITPDLKWENKKVSEVEVKTVRNSEGEIIGTETIEKTYNKNKEIDAIKYEGLRMCIEVLIDYDEEMDETLGSERALAKAPLSYKLAFNTLLHEGILKEIDE